MKKKPLTLVEMTRMGGKARAKALTPDQRRKIAAKGGNTKAANRELLEALRELLACSTPTGMDTRTDRAMARAEKAIARAEGL